MNFGQTIWASNGVDSAASQATASPGCLVGPAKRSRQKETITSLKWTLPVQVGRSLSRLNNREPESKLMLANLELRRSEQNTVPAACNRLLVGGGRVRPKLVMTVACSVVEDAGSIPASSTNLCLGSNRDRKITMVSAEREREVCDSICKRTLNEYQIKLRSNRKQGTNLMALPNVRMSVRTGLRIDDCSASTPRKRCSAIVTKGRPICSCMADIQPD